MVSSTRHNITLSISIWLGLPPFIRAWDRLCKWHRRSSPPTLPKYDFFLCFPFLNFFCCYIFLFFFLFLPPWGRPNIVNLKITSSNSMKSSQKADLDSLNWKGGSADNAWTFVERADDLKAIYTLPPSSCPTLSGWWSDIRMRKLVLARVLINQLLEKINRKTKIDGYVILYSMPKQDG